MAANVKTVGEADGGVLAADRKSGRSSHPKVTEETSGERFETLRHSRSGHAAYVTRKHKGFKISLNKGNTKEAADKFETLQEAFRMLEVKHNECLKEVPADKYSNYKAMVVVMSEAKQQLDELGTTKENDELGPDDSVSNAGSQASSCPSSTSSARAKAAAKKAALQAKEKFICQQ